MLAAVLKYAWYGDDCGGKQEECDTPRDDSVESAVESEGSVESTVESEETDQERMDRETYVSRVVTVIFDNVVQANIERYDTLHAFVEANATELSGVVLDQGAFVDRVLSKLPAALRSSFTTKKVVSSLKDLGIQPIQYIFDGLLPRRALRFPDFTRHKKVIRFLDERCIATNPGDLRSQIATTPGMYNAYVTFCEEEGLQATVADVVELAQVVKECGLDTRVEYLTPLSGLTALTLLRFSYNRVEYLTPLSGLTALKSLYFSGNSVKDLTPLSGLTALTLLDVPENNVEDLTPLFGLTGLTWLYT
eukprot:gene6064-biopygen1187